MSFSTLIIIFASDIILGLISIALAKYKIRKDKIYIDTFVENVIGLMNPKASKKAKHGNTDYVLRNYQEASRITGEYEYNCPISEFGLALSFDNPIDPSLFVRIDSDQKG